MKSFRKFTAFFLAVMLLFTMNICVLAEETEMYTVQLSPENYAGIFFNVTTSYHSNGRAIEAYYNTPYPTADYLYAEHFSKIASFNVPLKHSIQNISTTWWYYTSGLTNNGHLPIFYNLSNFSPDIENGVYKGISGSEEEGYTAIEQWATENYWPLDSFSYNGKSFASQLAYKITTDGIKEHTADITDVILDKYTADTCTSEHITLASGRETSGYSNSYTRMDKAEYMPYITVTYRASDILSYVNRATTENITKVISDIGAIKVLADSPAEEYKTLSDEFKQIVGDIVLSKKGENGFADFSEISAAFDEAMNLDNIILSIINSSTEENIAANMIKIGEAGAFSGSTTGYLSYLEMSAATKAEVNKNMLSKIPAETGFSSIADLTAAFDSAMVLKTVSFKISPENYATLYITGTGNFKYTDAFDLHYNRLYSRSNTLNALHMSIIAGFEIPFRERLTGIGASYYFVPGNNTSTGRIQPFFYDLSRFEIDAEAGIYDDTTPEYQTALTYAKNYWPDEGVWNYNSSKFNIAYTYNDMNASGFDTRTLDITPNVLAALKKSANDYLTLTTGRPVSQYMNYQFEVDTTARIPTLTLTYYEADILDIINNATVSDIVGTLDKLAKAGTFEKTQTGADLYFGLTSSGKKEVGVNLLGLRGENGFESIEELQVAWDNAMTLEKITTEIQPNNYAVTHTQITPGSYGYGSYHDKNPGGTYTAITDGTLLKSYVNSWTMSDFSRKAYANLYSSKVMAEYKIPMKSSLSSLVSHNELTAVQNNNNSGFDVHYAFDKFSFSTAPAVYAGSYDSVVSDTNDSFEDLYNYATSSIWQAGPQNVQQGFASGIIFNEDIDLTSYALSGFKASSSDYILTRAGGASIYDGWRLTSAPTLKLSYTASSVLDYINAQTDVASLIDDLGSSGLLNASASGYVGYKGLDTAGKTAVSSAILADLTGGGYDSYADFTEAYDKACESYLNEAVFLPAVEINFDSETASNTGTDTRVAPSVTGDAEYVTGPDGSKALYIENDFGKTAQNYLDLGKYNFGENNFSIVFWLRAVNAGLGEFGHDADGASSCTNVPVDFTANSYIRGGVVLSNKDFATNDNTGFAFTAMPASADFGVNTKISDNDVMNTVGIGDASDSRWHRIAYTVDRSGNAVTYVDNTKVASFNIASSLGSIDSSSENTRLIFGADGLGQYGMNSGEFDDIRIYPFAINESKLEEMYYEKMLAKTIFEADTLLNTESMSSIYSETNKTALSEKLAEAKAYSDGYVYGSKTELIEKYEEFNEYYNDFLNKDSLGTALLSSDIHISERSAESGHGLLMKKSLNQHKELGIDLKTWVTAGDYSETGNNHQHFFFDLLDSNIPGGVNAVVARGNHDEPANGSRKDSNGNTISLSRDELREEFQDRMDKYFDKDNEINKKLIGEDGTLNEPYYYLTDGMAHYIVIDNYDTSTTRWISPEQFVWLEETLDAISGDGKAIFIIQHLPITGSVASSTGGYYLYEEYGTQLVNLLNSYENDNIFLFNGHTHNGLGGGCNTVVDFGNFYQINLPSLGKGGGKGYHGVGTAFYANVYDDRVVFRARNFDTDEWLRDYDLTFMLKEAEISVTVEGEKVSIQNKPEEYTLILASYSDEKLLDIKYTSDVGTDNEITFEEMGLVTDNATEIKAMLWNSLDSMKPLCR